MTKIGKYEVIKELGSGATSTVYLAFDSFNNRKVAIKLFTPQTLEDMGIGRVLQKLFLTEAGLAGKLEHPHIVSIYDAVADDQTGESYLVMEYVEGTTLDKFCDPKSMLPPRIVVEIMYKCCKALEYAQRIGIIHRDIKPANILKFGESDIKISDFGAALSPHTPQATQVMKVGSPAYMSPEQVQDLPLTHQTDIYSLGVVMYRMLSGKMPFEASSDMGLIYQITSVEPSPPSAHRPSIPPELDEIVRRAMAKKQEERYLTWQEFAQDLVHATEHVDYNRDTVLDTAKFSTLRSLAFFQEFTDVELWEVVRLSKWSKPKEGEWLLEEGQEGESFFILASGEVEVVKQGKLLATLKTGDCFGEMAYLVRNQKLKRTASIMCTTKATVIEIDADLLSHSSDSCRNRFSTAFLAILVNRLAAANTRLSQFLTEQKVTVY